MGKVEEKSEEVTVAPVSAGATPVVQGFQVASPSGSKMFVLTQGEKAYYEDRAKRYLADNHFVNVSDLQDVDRLLMLELMVTRWGTWLSQETDYWGGAIDPDVLQKSVKEYSTEIRQVKRTLGIDKLNRDKEKGESVADYIETLRKRAREFGVMRNEQAVKAITLFKELEALMIFYTNCDERERQENNVEVDDVIEWITKVAIPEFNVIDEKFRENQQKYWIKEL